ncbi:Crp/Fnr family transcriptional regulator [Fibrella aquatilis]|uniref:Crp/Fnr family transcriptional regulator n=1 Tax=Fibrella aquatilis TaxID=2817059 RepID=A0A939G7R6_9BACT|nr:Crp/Fnr family transcriptional regulator [Fibrella aquatilis]MBO0931935.1 Crp/Fnr family transcriptional regulator [Fibrella aquatilis]
MNPLQQVLTKLTPQPAEAAEAFLAAFREQTVAKGETVIRAGAQTRQIFFVEEGVLRAYSSSAEGAEYNKAFFVEHDLWGIYYALLTGQPSHLSVQALTPCRLLVADYKLITDLYGKYPTLERAGRRMAEELFVLKEQREIDLVMLDATARYANFQRLYPGLEQRIPQYHIASHLGITPTQLSRIRAVISLPM